MECVSTVGWLGTLVVGVLPFACRLKEPALRRRYRPRKYLKWSVSVLVADSGARCSWRVITVDLMKALDVREIFDARFMLLVATFWDLDHIS